MVEIDIIIPLYNKARTIARAIQSVCHQTVADWRLFIVNDGSTDDGADIVRSINEPRLTMIQQENTGPGGARNTGIAAGNAPYLAFLDADDEWYPWYLANALSAIKKNDVAIVGTMYYQWPQQQDMTAIWANWGITPGIHQLRGNEDPVWTGHLTPFYSPWNTLALRHFVEKYGGFYGHNRCMRAEDETLMMRIIFNHSVMIIVPPAVRYHVETSTIGHQPRAYPLEPFLADPNVLLDYCPKAKIDLLHQLLDIRALWTATNWAYHGEVKRAEELLGRFPGIKNFPQIYQEFCFYAYQRPRWWTQLKCRVGAPIRQVFRQSALRLGLRKRAPLMPYEKEMR